MIKRKALSAQRAGNSRQIKYSTLASKNNFSTLSFVKKYLSLELPIIPVSPREKTPRVAKNDTWQREFLLDEFHEGDNIGLKCGVKWQGGYLFAIDFDSNDEEKFFKLVQTLQENEVNGIIQRSGGKHQGFHFIGKVDEPIEGSKITFKGAEIDIKGNGYVLIAPSLVKTRYQILKGNFQELQTNKKEKLIKSLKKTEKELNLKDSQKNILTTCHEDTGYSRQVVSIFSDEDKQIVSKPLIVHSLAALERSSDALRVWQRLLALGGTSVDNLKLDEGFSCVLHRPDKHPSARLHLSTHGEIFYLDEHLNGTKLFALPLQAVYQGVMQLKRGEKLHITANVDKSVLKRLSGELIDVLNIYTQDAIDYVKALNEFIKEAVKRERIPKRYVKVWRRIADKMMRAYDHGGDIFTARWLERETGVNHVSASQALNVLVACSVLRKGEEKEIEYEAKGKKFHGKTFIIEPVEDFDIVDALRILSLIHENLRKRKYDWDKFSRKAVINVLSKAVAETIFTRDHDEKIRKEPKKEAKKKPVKSFWSYGGIFEKHMRKSVEELLNENSSTPLSVSYMKDIKYPCKRSCYQKLKRQIEKEATVSLSG